MNRLPVADKRIRLKMRYARWPVQLRRFIEWSGFATVRISALIFLATVEDAVEAPDDGLFPDIISETEARADVGLVPGDDIGIDLATANRNGDGEREPGKVTPLMTAGALKLGDSGAFWFGPLGM